jgi:hypothetical protein
MQKRPAPVMTRETFAEKLALRMLACEGIRAIWQLHVTAADAERRGQPAVAAILIEIADAAEREWRLAATGQHELGFGTISPGGKQ